MIETNEDMQAWEIANRTRLAALRHEEALPLEYVGRWVPVSEMLPPERFSVLVTIAAEPHLPQFAWLKYAAGEVDSPFFVCPARA